MEIKGTITETLVIEKDVEIEVPEEMAKKAALGDIDALGDIRYLLQEKAYEDCLEYTNGWEGVETVEIEVEQKTVSVGPRSDPENLKLLGFSELEIKLLVDLKTASDHTYEETRCGVAFGCSVDSDEDWFEAAKSLTSKGYLESAQDWEVPPGEIKTVEYLPTLKFSALMGTLCLCHKDLERGV